MSLRDYERVMKAAADPTRLRILKLLERGELCVCQVVAVLELSQSTVSKHLYLLKAAGLVKERREGKWVHYGIAGSEGSQYGRKVLRAIKEWLNADPVVELDGKRDALARKIGPSGICARGMTLPARRAAAAGAARSRQAAPARRARGAGPSPA